MIIEIPEAVPLMNKYIRMHWAEKRKITERYAWLVRDYLGKWTEPPIEKCSIIVERYSAGKPDVDAIVVKPLLDVLVVGTKKNPWGQGIILDDNPDVVQELIIRAKKGGRGQGKTIVRIEKVPSENSHNAYQRKHRRRHGELSDEQKMRANCRSHANIAKRRGQLIQKPCEKCGEKNSQMHHEDYSNHLEVNWFCRSCHLALHQEKNKKEILPLYPWSPD